MPPRSRFPRDLGCMLFFFPGLPLLIAGLSSIVVPNLVSYRTGQRMLAEQAQLASLLRAHASISQVRQALRVPLTEVSSTFFLYRAPGFETRLYFDPDGRLVNFAIERQ